MYTCSCDHGLSAELATTAITYNTLSKVYTRLSIIDNTNHLKHDLNFAKRLSSLAVLQVDCIVYFTLGYNLYKNHLHVVLLMNKSEPMLSGIRQSLLNAVVKRRTRATFVRHLLVHALS